MLIWFVMNDIFINSNGKVFHRFEDNTVGHIPHWKPLISTGHRDSDKNELWESDVFAWDDGSHGAYWRVAEIRWEDSQFIFRTLPELCINCRNNVNYDYRLANFSYLSDPNKQNIRMILLGNTFEGVDLNRIR